MFSTIGIFVEIFAPPKIARWTSWPTIIVLEIICWILSKGDGKIDLEITKYALEALNVDAYGLDEMDNKILTTLIKNFKGGPVGITTLSTAVSETAETIEEVYEPFLIQQGFIVRTPRGRQVTDKAYKHLGLTPLSDQNNLFS